MRYRCFAFFKITLLALLLLLVGVGVYHTWKPLPEGINFTGPARSVASPVFLADRTYVEADGTRHSEQVIFDEIKNMIARAERFVLVDMFLFNEYQGAMDTTHRALASELTQALIQQKQRHPAMQVLVVSDPLNTVYGGLASPHFAALEEANIPVTLTRLPRLRDSNPLYSSLWRPFIQPWGNSEGKALPNPFGEGRVSVRSYLALLNFKANHRKLAITDDGDQLVALVTSANPHDGSSAHGNVALRFGGAAAWDLLDSETAVLAFSNGPTPVPGIQRARTTSDRQNPATLRIVTERAVERAVLDMLQQAQPGDRVDMAMFYVSDRHIVHELRKAAERGVVLRLLLDPNKDAFGREKNGVPNRPVAHELVQAGVSVRWCDTHGEQCHAKWLMHRSQNGKAQMLLGSTNFTRRNLHNLNLETSVLLSGETPQAPFREAADWFDDRWSNRDDRQYSVAYEAYADERLWPRLLYRIMETTGLSTF
ncbi:phospholipase D-like domain-containing protein [Marinimicrobium sp. ARAG 43.8]|uniref:phospholipase D-like domain-containing protein n=1 Tax=Marinimicrobium sp. ARAG 43.8 TaxID=3418719 RepID=UPI003CF551E0